MSCPPANIPGGYVLIARKILESELMNKPPHYLKLWVWMLGKAFWRNGDKLRRGQFYTTIAEMQEAMSYKSGYRKITVTRDEIRSAYGHFTDTTMVTITATTRGMVISICNYEAYQNPESYGPHTGPHTGYTADPTGKTKQYKQEKENPILSDFFGKLWGAYPRRDGKKAALRHFLATVKTQEDMDLINLALGNYLGHVEGTAPQFIKTGSTWFNNWRDWIPEEETDAT